MKLSAQDTTNLVNILSTCSVGDIQSVIIEDGLVRGINESKTCVIISDFNVPKFPQKIGLSRLGSLKQRLDLFTNAAGTVIDAKESDRGEISSLDISAGRNKVQYRCTSTMLIKAPKVINDEAAVRVFVEKDELKMVLNAIKVMGGKKVLIAIKKDRAVSFQISDATNDNFSSAINTPAERLSDEDMDSVAHYYPADIFFAVFKNQADEFDTIAFDVGAVGTIKTKVNGHAITLLPQINEDAED
jgi:hypothetical protein